MSEQTRKTKAQPPEDFTGLKTGKPKEVAAGIPAVISSGKHMFGQTHISKGLQLLTMLNQNQGFDCPSCAWPDPDDERSWGAEFCENGAKAVADEATNQRVTPAFFQKYSVEALTEESDYWLNKQGRLTHPMVLKEGSSHYQEISWDEAFETIGEELNKLASPNEALFYTSGRTSNEAAFLYQLFVRQYGTNNLPDCSNMCHESSGTGLSEAIGIGKGTVTLDDFNKAELILVVGQNPGTNHPRMLTALEKAKQNGAKIVSINPLKETGLVKVKNPQDFKNPLKGLQTVLGSGNELSDMFVPVKVGGDIALAKGVMKSMFELEASGRQIVAQDFIDNKTEGFDAFKKDIVAESWEKIVAESGISQEEIEKLALMCADNNRIIICWAMGLTQHKHAVAAIQEFVNLVLIKGSIGKEGAGLCPVRGHSNVQGDRTMGIWEKPKDAFLDKLDSTFEFKSPREHGYDTVEAIKAMHSNEAKVFFAMGGNFLSATPDTEYTADALRNCELTVQVSTKLNRSHLITGKKALILPCIGRTESDVQASGQQFVSCENSMGVVQKSQGQMAPASEHLLSEPAIVARLAEATLQDSKVDWSNMVSDYDNIRNAIETVIPGFENYNERVRVDAGFYLPNGPREGNFTTATGKAQFTVHAIPDLSVDEDEFIMMTLRSHDQFNTTIYGLDDRYRGIYNERRVVMLNKGDMNKHNIAEGDVLDLTSLYEGETRIAKKFIAVGYDVPRGSAVTYFPEANVLVPVNSVAERSNTPTSKYVRIKLHPAS